MQDIEIKLADYYLRSINTNENLKNYLYWMKNPDNNPYILSANKNYTLSRLKKYIEYCNSDKNTLLLGIFKNEQNSHIGNIKYENIDFVDKSAVMGILIGEKDFRGLGLAKLVIESTSNWLSVNLGLRKLFLGVDSNNLVALKLYTQIGFKIVGKKNQRNFTMSMDINV